jgi:hypothetical protein
MKGAVRREDFYVYCFCEENVYRLIDKAVVVGNDWAQVAACFVSNKNKTTVAFFIKGDFQC